MFTHIILRSTRSTSKKNFFSCTWTVVKHLLNSCHSLYGYTRMSIYYILLLGIGNCMYNDNSYIWYQIHTYSNFLNYFIVRKRQLFSFLFLGTRVKSVCKYSTEMYGTNNSNKIRILFVFFYILWHSLLFLGING